MVWCRASLTSPSGAKASGDAEEVPTTTAVNAGGEADAAAPTPESVNVAEADVGAQAASTEHEHAREENAAETEEEAVECQQNAGDGGKRKAAGASAGIRTKRLHLDDGSWESGLYSLWWRGALNPAKC